MIRRMETTTTTEVLCVECGAPTDGDKADLRCNECRAHAPVQPLAADAAQAPALPPVTHVRVGGRAGLSVTNVGPTTHKRVSAIDPPSPDHTLVPKEILAEVRRLLDETSAAPIALVNVRELLAPWL